jgi:chaperone required for assembly of F1-ATPase
MSAWAAKRFWKQAQAVPCDGGFSVTLDTKPLRTPAKRLLVLPTERLAAAIAAEWDAQTGKVRPETMPMTRFANSAQEKVAPQLREVADYLATYAETDLLCYRATGPESLIRRQAAGWDPLLAWAAVAHQAPLVTVQGVMPVAQPAASLTRLRAALDGFSAFQLAGFHDLVGLGGSFVLALALVSGQRTAEEAFDLSRIDEIWQAELWGQDETAAEQVANKRRDFLAAYAFWQLSTAI